MRLLHNSAWLFVHSIVPEPDSHKRQWDTRNICNYSGHSLLTPQRLRWRMKARVQSGMAGAYSSPPSLSLTVLGHPCIERYREAWHPQGPIHPQPHPVPLQVVHPRSHPCRSVAWWRGGSSTCSGTGRHGGAVGPLRVPCVPTLFASQSHLPAESASGEGKEKQARLPAPQAGFLALRQGNCVPLPPC